MARTTAELVKGIIEVDELTSDLAPYIETANELVTELCAPAGYLDSRLELIERWLAAHFYAVTDPRLKSESFGKSSGEYQSKIDLHLNLSHYGQQAQLLDTQGKLAQLNEAVGKGKPQATIKFLGSTSEEQAEYGADWP